VVWECEEIEVERQGFFLLRGEEGLTEAIGLEMEDEMEVEVGRTAEGDEVESEDEVEELREMAVGRLLRLLLLLKSTLLRLLLQILPLREVILGLQSRLGKLLRTPIESMLEVILLVLTMEVEEGGRVRLILGQEVEVEGETIGLLGLLLTLLLPLPEMDVEVGGGRGQLLCE
jgi:hypothetical protein